MKYANLPPLNTLRAFEAAARLGSFAAAAVELNLTAAAISHRIKELEGRLNIPMFVRQPRGVLLTEAGRRYHERLADIFTQIEQAAKALSQKGIGGPDFIGPAFLYSPLAGSAIEPFAPTLSGFAIEASSQESAAKLS